jgi:AraC-like DNA-binding protein
MALSGTEIGQYLSVCVHWARLHQWPRGTKWNDPPLPAYVMWLLRQGVVDVMLDGKKFCIKAGEVWLHPYVPNRFITVREDAEWLTLGMEATIYDNADALAPLSFTQWQPARRKPLEMLLEELVRTERADSWEGKLMHHSLACAVVGWCWEERGGGLQQLVQEHLSPWLRNVLQAMRDDLRVGVQEHIARSGYSPAQFRRHFHQIMRCSPHEYLTRIRMERARQLLETTPLPVTEIADKAGFANSEHFTRQFKKSFNMAPSQYRQISKRLKM